MRSRLCVDGFFGVEVVESGRVVWKENKKNMVVVSGLNLQRDLLLGTGPTVNTMALGSGGSTATNASMDSLVSESIRRTFTRVDSQPMRLIYQLVLPASDPGVSITLSEAGLFAGYTVSEVGGNPDVGGGVMFSRVVFTEIVKATDQSINFTWDIPFSTGV